MSTYKQPNQRQSIRLIAAGLAGLIFILPVAAMAESEPDEAADTEDFEDAEVGNNNDHLDAVPKAAPPLISRVTVPIPTPNTRLQQRNPRSPVRPGSFAAGFAHRLENRGRAWRSDSGS